MPSFTDDDVFYMRSALALARRGLGRTWPNPSVGCVIVSTDGVVVGRARTADGGRPHAEVLALAQAGEAAHGGTAYVTLEPCSHYGVTPPCAAALVNAGLKRVFFGVLDPDQRVVGQGLAYMRQNGVIVETGLLAEACRRSVTGHILRKTEGRPWVTLKIASSLDARVSTETGDSQWITGTTARDYGHIERAQHDAVMVGSGTVLTDSPRLSVRAFGMQSCPVRIVVDTNLRSVDRIWMPEELSTAPLWIITAADPEEDAARRMKAQGAEMIYVSRAEDGRCDLREALQALALQGLTRVLVEGGPGLVSGFVRAGMYDRLLWFRAPCLLGAGGKTAVEELDILTLADREGLERRGLRVLGADLLEIYERPV